MTTGHARPVGLARARWRIRSATLTSASASRKWLITLTHASFTSTEMPPTIASHQNSAEEDPREANEVAAAAAGAGTRRTR